MVGEERGRGLVERCRPIKRVGHSANRLEPRLLEDTAESAGWGHLHPVAVPLNGGRLNGQGHGRLQFDRPRQQDAVELVHLQDRHDPVGFCNSEHLADRAGRIEADETLCAPHQVERGLCERQVVRIPFPNLDGGSGHGFAGEAQVSVARIDGGQSGTRPEAISEPPGVEPVPARHVDHLSVWGDGEDVEDAVEFGPEGFVKSPLVGVIIGGCIGHRN